jgi:plasmid replication initiation protein
MIKSKQVAKGTNIAVRPNEIIEARFNLTARENDILDFVLSRLEDDDIHTYRLQVDDFKNIYKTDTSNVYRDLKKATLSIYHKGFKITTDRSEAHFHWFSSIEYIEKDGVILCELGQRLKEILLNMKKRIYYKIDFTFNLSSIYSKRIYYYLCSFKDTGWRIDKVDELRKKLQCPESYNKYSLFKNKVLDVAQKEINANTDLNFTYEQIYTKNKVTSIKFLIEIKEQKDNLKQEKEDVSSKRKITYEFVELQKIVSNCSDNYLEMLELFASKEIAIEDFKNISECINSNEKLELIYIKIKEQLQYKLSTEIVANFHEEINKLLLHEDQQQLINQVKSIIDEQLTDKDILSILAVANNDIDLVKDKYILSKNYDIKNLTAWLIKAIKDDFKQVAGATTQANKNKSNNKFNNYEQRDYNFDELERKAQNKLSNKQYNIN